MIRPSKVESASYWASEEALQVEDSGEVGSVIIVWALPDHIEEIPRLTTSKQHSAVVDSFVKVLNALCERLCIDLSFFKTETVSHLGNDAEPEGHADMPDILCKAKSHDGETAWEFIISCGEVLSTKLDTLRSDRCRRYGRIQQHYNPHAYRSLVLMIDQVSRIYKIAIYTYDGEWIDTEESKFDSNALLQRYLQELGREEFYDRRLKPVEFERVGGKGKRTRTAFDFDLSGEKYHLVTLFQGTSETRTYVAIAKPCGASTSGKLFIVKLQNQRVERRSSEYNILMMLKDVHGVAKLAFDGRKIPDATIGRGTYKVRKTILLDTVARPLSCCKDLVEILKVFFDLVEGHRWMLEKGILHRDASFLNCMMAPLGYYAANTGKYFVDDLLNVS